MAPLREQVMLRKHERGVWKGSAMAGVFTVQRRRCFEISPSDLQGVYVLLLASSSRKWANVAAKLLSALLFLGARIRTSPVVEVPSREYLR